MVPLRFASRPHPFGHPFGCTLGERRPHPFGCAEGRGALRRFGAPKGVEGEGRGALHRFGAPKGVEGEAPRKGRGSRPTRPAGFGTTLTA